MAKKTLFTLGELEGVASFISINEPLQLNRGFNFQMHALLAGDIFSDQMQTRNVNLVGK